MFEASALNVVTWKRAYCTYPLQSALKHTSLIVNQKMFSIGFCRSVIQNISHRGFQIARTMDEFVKAGGEMHPTWKFFGDRWCWCIHLGTLYVQEGIEDDGVEGGETVDSRKWWLLKKDSPKFNLHSLRLSV